MATNALPEHYRNVGWTAPLRPGARSFLWSKLRECYARWLAASISSQSLAAFRILFGVIMAVAMLRLLVLGWVEELYMTPKFHLPYPGLEWVRAWPGCWMYVHVAALAGCGFGIALGFRYRVCALLFLCGFIHLELIDQTTYLNHYYLVTLLSGLLACMPAHGMWSMDAWRDVRLRRSHVPAWTVNLLRFQIGIVYFFAGVAKLNPDWLWRAQPLRIWLPARTDLPLVGLFFDQVWLAYAASWFGAAFDLTIPFLLLSRRTRGPAYFILAGFHLLTGLLFHIGMFPWIMLSSVLIFLPPNWPVRLLQWVKPRCEVEGGSGTGTKLAAPRDFTSPPARPLPWWQLSSLGAYALLQVVIPLREFLYPEPSAWGYRGFNFAWKVMIAEKSGFVTFRVTVPESQTEWRIDASEYLTPRQAALMAQDPDLIRITARLIARNLQQEGYKGVQVRADAFATLNGRLSQRMIVPEVDLAAPRSTEWIIPLDDAPSEVSAGRSRDGQ